MKSSKRNIGKIWKTWRSKSTRKECSNGENCQEDLRQRSYMDGQTNDMTRSIEKNWRRWKGKKPVKRETMKMIPEEEETEEEKSGIREWTEEDNDEIGNLVNPYYEL